MKKILIITQRDPFFIDTFLQEIKTDCQVVILDLPNFNKGKIWAIKRAIDLYGYFGFLKLILIRIKSLLFDRKKINSIKLSNKDKINPYIKELKQGDILLSLSAPSIIDSSIIPSGVNALNIHSGSLPKYAGMMPIFWQMFDKQKSITITFHELAEGIDTGNIYHEEIMPVGITLFQTSVDAKKVAAKVFSEKFLEGGFKVTRSQTSDKHMLNKFPEKKDIAEIKNFIKLI